VYVHVMQLAMVIKWYGQEQVCIVHIIKSKSPFRGFFNAGGCQINKSLAW